jgi:hypothetical protein
MTLKDVSELIGLKYISVLSNWETGKIIDPDHIEKSRNAIINLASLYDLSEEEVKYQIRKPTMIDIGDNPTGLQYRCRMGKKKIKDESTDTKENIEMRYYGDIKINEYYNNKYAKEATNEDIEFILDCVWKECNDRSTYDKYSRLIRSIPILSKEDKN